MCGAYSNWNVYDDHQKEISQEEQNKAGGSHGWLFYAVLSAVFASFTSILGKVGIEGINSNLGTAIRTIVVLIMAWIVVFVTGKQHTIKHIEKKSLALSAFRDLQQAAHGFAITRHCRTDLRVS